MAGKRWPRRIWARLRDPYNPGRQVIGARARDGTIDPESIFELIAREDETVKGTTERERLLHRKAELASTREKLAREAEEARRRGAESLAQGRPVAVPQRDYDREIAQLVAAEAEVDRQLHDERVIAEYVTSRRAAIEREKEVLDRERAPLLKAIERTSAALEQAEQQAQRLAHEQRGRREKLAEEERHLSEVEWESGRESPRQSDPRTVATHLNEFRARGLGTVVRDQDPSLDEAVAAYEREVEQLRSWKRAAELAASETGRRVPPPECARHYSRARIREICRDSLGAGPLGTGSRTSTKREGF